MSHVNSARTWVHLFLTRVCLGFVGCKPPPSTQNLKARFKFWKRTVSRVIVCRSFPFICIWCLEEIVHSHKHLRGDRRTQLVRNDEAPLNVNTKSININVIYDLEWRFNVIPSAAKGQWHLLEFATELDEKEIQKWLKLLRCRCDWDVIDWAFWTWLDFLNCGFHNVTRYNCILLLPVVFSKEIQVVFGIASKVVQVIHFA